MHNLYELELSTLWRDFITRRHLGPRTERAQNAFTAHIATMLHNREQVVDITFCQRCYGPETNINTTSVPDFPPRSSAGGPTP